MGSISNMNGIPHMHEVPGLCFRADYQHGVIKKLPVPDFPIGVDFSLLEKQIDGDQVLAEISTLKHLQWIQLGNLTYTEKGLRQLAGSTTLKAVVMGNFSKDDDLKQIAKIRSLRTLYLNRNKEMTDRGIRELAALKQLEWLDLSGTGVTDAGMKELAALKELSWINLSGTSVTDVTAAQLRSLNKLSHVDLAYTGVSQDGLREVAKIKGMKSLDMSGTEARGNKDLGTSKMRELRLNNTSMTDEDLKAIPNLKEIKHLNLSGTKITDKGLESLAGLNLDILEIPEQAKTDLGLKNYLAAINLEPVKRYMGLSLSSWNISEEGLKTLAGLELPILEIPNMAKTDIGLKYYLAAIAKKDNLYLEKWSITGKGFREIAKYPQVQAITINAVEPLGGIEELKALPKLMSLQLSGPGMIVDCLKQLTQLQHLEYLELINTPLNDEVMNQWSGFNKLKFLHIVSDSITDVGMKSISNHKQLTDLKLMTSKITDVSMKSFSSMPLLKALEVYGAAITDDGLLQLAGMKNLKQLSLINTKVTSEGIKKLKAMMPKAMINNYGG
ncbi:MAG TPA: hypothetical protein PLN21_08325 [Gemmatales bacterium]|nr:hypothetical protein [Gemmatales bacterium]